ncbi:hypothetical protein HK097_004646 [Rhizophlyctis rosea]|uniref:Uncharacterized protein n=1 Tax=Rhizophlyctis rosea TaxID=64517 RepID=A0AAD5SG11_9FUNG|nr:hypothetical protein HK097_004646 [Rhizophlyctis rosea]
MSKEVDPPSYEVATSGTIYTPATNQVPGPEGQHFPPNSNEIITGGASSSSSTSFTHPEDPAHYPPPPKHFQPAPPPPPPPLTTVVDGPTSHPRRPRCQSSRRRQRILCCIIFAVVAICVASGIGSRLRNRYKPNTLTPTFADPIRSIGVTSKDGFLFAAYKNHLHNWNLKKDENADIPPTWDRQTNVTTTGNMVIDGSFVYSVGGDGIIRSWNHARPNIGTLSQWTHPVEGDERVVVAFDERSGVFIWANGTGLYTYSHRTNTEVPVTLADGTQAVRGKRWNLKIVRVEDEARLFAQGPITQDGTDFLEQWTVKNTPEDGTNIGVIATLISNTTINIGSTSPFTAKGFDVSPKDNHAFFFYNNAINSTLQIALSTGQIVRYLQVPSTTTCLALSRDGKYLFTGHAVHGGGVAPVVRWDIEKGMEKGRYAGHSMDLVSLAIVPDEDDELWSASARDIRRWEF